MHYFSLYSGDMTTPSERLKAAREASGHASAKEAAESMGCAVATYIQHENGTRGLPAARAKRYAEFFRTTPEWLLYGRETKATVKAALGPQIPIQGEVAAGVFKEGVESQETEWETFTGAASVVAPESQRFGLKVVGDSMDLLYPEGSILECVRYWGDHPIESGKRVIVERTRDDGGKEVTVKQHEVDKDGVVWLVPKSSNPAHQAPFRVGQLEEGISDVSIIAIVVASLRLE